MSAVLLWVAVGAGVTLLIVLSLRAAWLVRGAYRIRRAGPRPLLATHHTIWRDPGAVESLDLSGGPGGAQGAPAPPFSFLEEHRTGSQPCVSVTDARGRRWRVKWGDEVRAENFAVRLVWACGYHAETTYYVEGGAITGAPRLQRASACIAEDGSFREARFELGGGAVRKHLEGHSWAWNDNPFVGTPQLNG